MSEACGLIFKAGPGPHRCPACKHVYVEWLTYNEDAMQLRISKEDFIEAGGNANDFHKEYRDGEIMPTAVLNIVMERYRGMGKIMSVIPDKNAEWLNVDIR